MDAELRMQARMKFLQEEERKELSESAGFIAAFREECAKNEVVVDDEHFRYAGPLGVYVDFPKIVEKICPDLVRDKDGLYDFKLLKSLYRCAPFSGGLLEGEKYILMAHPYFRRGYYDKNNFAPSFLDLFWRLDDVNMETYISLDPHRVRVNVDGSSYIERDAWFAATFSKDIASIKDGIGKYRPPLDLDEFHVEFFFNSTYSLDIKWATKDNIKTFYAEEFKTDKVLLDKDGEQFFPAKYIHAEFDLTTGSFRHFDGAIHFYTLDEYCERIDSDLHYNAKNALQIKSSSMKLFKINGVISVDTWVELTSHFFTGNPLIFEYFEGELPDYITDILRKVRARSQG